MIFDHISQVEHETISIHVSFMEIYKEMAFDLLGFIQGKDTGKAKQVRQIVLTLYCMWEKLLNAVWPRQSAFFLNHKGTFGSEEGTIT